MISLYYVISINYQFFSVYVLYYWQYTHCSCLYCIGSELLAVQCTQPHVLSHVGVSPLRLLPQQFSDFWHKCVTKSIIFFGKCIKTHIQQCRIQKDFPGLNPRTSA